MSTGPSLADLVQAGLRRTTAARRAVSARHSRGAITAEQWTAALGELYAREARWWGVLVRLTIADHSVPMVYVSAVMAVQDAAAVEAERWFHSAAEHARTRPPAQAV